MKTIELPVRVYIEDTDAGGIVYYVNYLKYMERARTEYLRSRGVQQSDTMVNDTAFVVHSVSARYLSPARLDDELVVTCEVTQLRAASVTFYQEVRRAGQDGPLCTGEVRVVCVSTSDMKPKAMPEGVFTGVDR